MSDSKIPLAGVIGSPISHSKSPMLHGYWIKKYGISGHYVPLHVEPVNLETVLRTLPEMGFVGANVTIPHKEAIFNIADVVSDRARIIGAANTLLFTPDGKIEADNTDGYGFITNLRRGAPDWSPVKGPAMVLGAGGAARAVIWALLDADVPKIFLTNRTRGRADQLQSEFGERIEVVDWNQAAVLMGEADLLVNSTSLGMVGKPPLEISLERLRAGTTVTDLVYTPLKTDLLDQAEAKGCAVVDGLGMLIHQAVPGFERWFGRQPDVTEEVREILLR